MIESKIPYVEVIDKYVMTPCALVNPSQCWFELSYYELGEFEVYASASPNNLNALKMGNYVRIPNKPYIWVIKSVEYKFSANGSRMISAKGFDAKWILTRRIIMTPYQLQTDLKEAVFNLVDKTCGLGAVSYRKVKGFKAVKPSYSITIEQTQATRDNLWTFLQALLRANYCGSYTTYNKYDWSIYFNSIQGEDKSQSIIFSQSLDNLISSDYYESSDSRRTYCQIVSTFTENDVQKDYVEEYELQQQNPDGTYTSFDGIDRSEMTIQSNISTKVEDSDEEVSPSSDLYKSWQKQEGKNQLAENISKKEFKGEIDLQYSQYEFEKDFFIGDLVMIRDEYFGYSSKARIIKYTFKQDAKGYGEEIEYQAE